VVYYPQMAFVVSGIGAVLIAIYFLTIKN